MLGGQVPEGGKMVTDSKGTKIDIPHTALSGGFLSDDSMTMAPNTNLAPANNPTPKPQGGTNFANHFVSSQSEISPSDLAGLNPQDISNALSGAMSAESLRQKKVTDVADSIYKQKMMEYYDTLIGEKTPSVTIPGTDIKLTKGEYLDWYKTASKDDRTAAIKNYELAQSQGYKGSFVDFQDSSKTTHKKDYDEAVAGGYRGTFNEWMLAMAKAGATTIGDITGRAQALADIKGQTYFKDPKWTSDLDKQISSEEVQNELFQLEGDAKVQRKAEYKVEFIENKITAGGGTVTDIKWAEDGKTMVWTVKWPSGDTEEVKHAVRN
jgi:hypothetical protein